MSRRCADRILTCLIYGSALLTVLLLVGMMGYVIYRGAGSVNWEFLTGVKSFLKGTEGIAGNIVNTLYMVILTLLMAVPVGVGSAVYLNEYAGGGRFVRIIEFTTEVLAGIPSIIFGLFGMIFFGATLGLGYSILTGALTLTLMILPLITRNTQEALKAVPDSYRQGALGMGCGKWYMIRTILMPSAVPGIVTGIILATGRIVGESAALLFTAGSGYLLPKAAKALFTKIMEPGGTLTIELYLNMSKARYDTAFGIALVLLCIVFAMNLLTKFIMRGRKKVNA